ncbi:hypothetical protein EVAR_99848_1 [Eumeta japonica]|uniref:Uncharacterized protein n=1 Tax=Eumeta variegata TaxID=151549 RepID=A0A4C2A6Z3_EUMVA|nr:hypothetical protein EVAR_99848_1 [Eumeta japonica]
MEAPAAGARPGRCRFMVCLTALISRPLIGRGPDERGVDDNGNAIRLSAGRRALIRHGLAALTSPRRVQVFRLDSDLCTRKS